MNISEGKIQDISSIKLEDKSTRVNINTLISRYKKEKAKEKTETLIFVGLATVLVVISGIIISL